MDLETDAPVDDGPSEAPEDAVLIVDGSFLQRGELASLWDHRVFVDTELDVARSRGIDRDADRLGGREEASRAYDLRYHAACRLYLDTVRPKETATLVVVNDDPSRPRLVRGAGGR